MSWYVLVCTGMYLHILMCWYELVCTGLYWYVLEYDWYESVRTRMYKNVLVHTSIFHKFWFSLIQPCPLLDTRRYKAVQGSTQKSRRYSFRQAPRREPNSSPRHEGAGPPSTLGGGGLV